MNLTAPAYEIRYREFTDEVLVQTFSLDGKKHSGEPRKLKWADMPTLLFQLADSGYTIQQGTSHIAFKTLNAFSRAFIEAAREERT